MAGGTRKPIQDVQVGDTVLATGPETGRPRKVTALITGSGGEHLVDITVDTNGASKAGTSTITATDGHPFWVPDLYRWTDAGDLTAGQWLQTSAGAWVQITAVDHRTISTTVRNFTVDDLHTYYVRAGGQDLLTHISTCLLGTKRHRTGSSEEYGFVGVGRWNWTRNKRFIDDALASGREIRLVTDPAALRYEKGNVFAKELRSLQGKGYGWRKEGSYWVVVPVR
ncbi:polymorphic toxin-type HINT domain-containing protein [Streptomyces sp. NPDC056716]|uniref:polymorphic toxin-type HINT domain-containing protein n=1 Tax=unclassified Streptomyces TaxID=2593676 RepID=UPI0036923EDE